MGSGECCHSAAQVAVDHTPPPQLAKIPSRHPDEVFRVGGHRDLRSDHLSVGHEQAVLADLLVEAPAILRAILPVLDGPGELDQRHTVPVRGHVALARLERRAEQQPRGRTIVEYDTDVARFGLGADEDVAIRIVHDQENQSFGLAHDHRRVPEGDLAATGDFRADVANGVETSVRTPHPVAPHDPLVNGVIRFLDRHVGLEEQGEVIRSRSHPKPLFLSAKPGQSLTRFVESGNHRPPFSPCPHTALQCANRRVNWVFHQENNLDDSPTIVNRRMASAAPRWQASGLAVTADETLRLPRIAPEYTCRFAL